MNHKIYTRSGDVTPRNWRSGGRLGRSSRRGSPTDQAYSPGTPAPVQQHHHHSWNARP